MAWFWFRAGRKSALKGELMSTEVIARLNPMSIHFGDNVGGGWGDDSPLDVAAALGMGKLGRTAYLLALCKFAGFDDVYPELFSWVKQYALTQRMKINPKKRTMYLEELVKTALDNTIDWGLCHWCNGTGQKRDIRKKGLSSCGKCSGSGKLKPTVFEIAKQAGIPRSTFKDTYKKEYDELIKYLDGLIARIETHLTIYYFRNGGNV